MLLKLNSGIEKIDDSVESEILDETIESNSEDESIKIENAENDFEPEKEPKTTKELAREKLTAKLDAGYDLSDKNVKARICHELAEEIRNEVGSCSYQAVAKEVNFVLKAKKEPKTEPEISNKGGNSIIKKNVEKLNRPPKKIINESENTESQVETPEEIFKKFNELQNQSDNSFEALSIKFALEDVSFLISALGLPKPQTKMLEQRAKQIASYNNLQRSKGNHENVIEVSDKILRYAIYLGLFSTFAQPIIKKYFPKDSKSKDGIETKNKSLRG